MFDFSAFAQGLTLGLGLFICPGPKDLLILRQALQRRPLSELLAVGVGSDALLIFLGIAGVSVFLDDKPLLQRGAMWLGVFLMLWHGFAATLRTVAPQKDVSIILENSAGKNQRILIVTSLFNPVAWMDTVLVIGTVGALLPNHKQLIFALGAISASAIWFLTLTLGARYVARWVNKPGVWRYLDAFVAVVMIVLALYIGSGLL
jgi:L-lysine exporter family protein LysE/ArgO